MTNIVYTVSAGALALALISGCGGGSSAPPVEVASRVDLLAQSERGIESLAFDGKNNSYLSLSTSATSPSSVLRTSGELAPGSQWTPVSLGGCAMRSMTESDFAPRSPRLKQADGKIFLFQPAYYASEASLCELAPAALDFAVNDRTLHVCYDAAGLSCSALAISDLQYANGRLYSNAGGAPNLLLSDDHGNTWHALLGKLEANACYNQSFHILGSRLLVGGECPLDEAYVRAYQLSKDGATLASPDPLPVLLPELENRNIQLITSVPGTQRVFIGVEGGLLRSEDGGLSFKFVIRQPIGSAEGYPYVTRLLSPANKPNVIVAAGFDKMTGKAYLAWSPDGGTTWTNLSKLLPGAERTNNDLTAQVTSLSEDAQGHLLLTMNEEIEKKGKLFKLTLGKP
jgi:hypothetical protein